MRDLFIYRKDGDEDNDVRDVHDVRGVHGAVRNGG
jgi:hypothetical protein